MAEYNEVPSFSISEGQEFAKLLIKKGFLIKFCNAVDPIDILKSVQLRNAHGQQIRLRANSTPNKVVNHELWDFIIKETEWVGKLYSALQLNEYVVPLAILEDALEEWKRRGHN